MDDILKIQAEPAAGVHNFGIDQANLAAGEANVTHHRGANEVVVNKFAGLKATNALTM